MAPESVPMLAQELDYAKSHDRLSFTPFESQVRGWGRGESVALVHQVIIIHLICLKCA